MVLLLIARAGEALFDVPLLFRTGYLGFWWQGVREEVEDASFQLQRRSNTM